MESQIIEIATAAGRFLLNPVAIIVPLLAVLALATGVAGRIAVFVEDWRQPSSVEIAALRLGTAPPEE